MKSLFNLRLFVAALFIAMISGCAGITEANLSDDTQTFDAANDQLIHQEVPDFVNGGDQEEMIDVRPTSSYDNR